MFICKNIADREDMWTNLRRNLVDDAHNAALSKPVAYLLACCKPEASSLNVWAIPEPVMYEIFSGLPYKTDDEAKSIQISTDKQRVDKHSSSPDLTPYSRQFKLATQEMHLLNDARKADALAKTRARAKKSDAESGQGARATESIRSKLLDAIAKKLMKAGEFDPQGIKDARKWVLSSVVRRMGQPAFRQHLLLWKLLAARDVKT